MRMEWAPHVIPCIAMLYLMRNAGEPPSGESVEGNETTEFGGGGEWGGEWGGRSFSSSRPDGKEPSLTHYGRSWVSCPVVPEPPFPYKNSSIRSSRI